MDTKDTLNLVQTVSSLVQLSSSIIDSIEKIKEGKPEEIDIDELKRILLSLPDLPEIEE